LSDDVRLDLGRAEAALEPLAEQLHQSLENIARGILLISSSAMANAIREITVERGYDPREAPIIAFGGAGPLFATLLARELESRTAIIPPAGGNFSAWGLIGADVVRESARTLVQPLTDESLAAARTVLAEMFAAIAGRSGLGDGEPEGALDLRYRGQEHTIATPIADDDTADSLALRFRDRYARTYLHELGHEIEFVAVRASLRAPATATPWPTVDTVESDESPTHHVYSFARQRRIEVPLINRAALQPGTRYRGGAVIVEPTTTTYADVDFVAHVDMNGFLILERENEE
jgi:N-methylhydantoinase A